MAKRTKRTKRKHQCTVKLCPECFEDYENGTITYEKKCKVVRINSATGCDRDLAQEER